MSKSENSEKDGSQYVKLREVINEPPAGKSPLLALGQKIESFFLYGPDAAFAVFQNLQSGIIESTCKHDGSRYNITTSSDLGLLSKIFGVNINASAYWKTATTATTLVLVFACSCDAETISAIFRDQGRTFGGLPSYELTRNTPSAALPIVFQKAKSAARVSHRTTVMVITIHDVHILELEERGDVASFFNFSHFFTVGLGPEGVILWQAGGPNGYGLDEYVRNGHARLRSWDEAEQFVRDFDELANEEGPWTAHIYALYKKLFLVDLKQICGVNGPEPPLTPEFKAWIRIRTFEDVTYEDITKFRWVGSE